MKILMVVSNPWDRRLGGARVQLEIAEQLAALGHEVDHFSLTDAFDHEPRTRIGRQLRRPFSVSVLRHLRRVGARYDVIDALEGAVPHSKHAFAFDGLLVARTVGRQASYREFVVWSQDRWPEQPRGHPLGRLPRRLSDRRTLRACEASFVAADLVNVPNREELAHFEAAGMGSKTVLFPYGLTHERSTALASAADIPARLRTPTVSFIGSWDLRKGAYDWDEIVGLIRRDVPGARFQFLGTWASESRVLSDLGLPPCDWIDVVPNFAPDDLPRLLSKATVGAFPSYAEGFGFAVLEQLAAGLPTVAYDVSGPREMLRVLGSQLLVLRGDRVTLANRVAAVLAHSPARYEALSRECRLRASDYSWPDIVRATEHEYQTRLAGLDR